MRTLAPRVPIRIALSSGVAALVLLAACGGEVASTSGEGTLAFATVPVEPSNFRVTVRATGIVEPMRMLDVKSLAAGEITELFADVGDRVGAGSILAEIDPRDVRNAFVEAEADLEVARARMEITRTQTERSRELLEAGVISEQEHEARNLEFANARSALLRAETNHQLAELRLADVRIRAPLSGTILSRQVDRGQVISSASGNVSGGTTLFTMADLDRVQVRIRVPESDLALIAPGLTVSVRPEAFPDRSFEGAVLKVEPQAVTEQNVVVFPVLIVLDNPDGLLRPGMNGSVEILVAQYPDALTIPATAVVQRRQVVEAATIVNADLTGWIASDDGVVSLVDLGDERRAEGAAVFVQEEGGRITPREVVVAPGDGTRVRILSGLRAGEVVISFAPPARAQSAPGGFGGVGGGAPGGGGGR